MKTTYIKINPNNSSAIIDKLELTEEQAKKRNQELRDMKSDNRWIIERKYPEFETGEEQS